MTASPSKSDSEVSNKTEMIEHNNERLEHILRGNLGRNVEQHIHCIDPVKLYNAILMNTEPIMSQQLEKELLTFLQLYMVKCHMDGLINEYNYIACVFEHVFKHIGQCKYIAMYSIVYCVNINFDAIKRNNSIMRSMYT